MSANFSPAMSTDEISVGSNSNLCLTDYLDELETDVSGKAASNHSHNDLAAAIEGLEDGKAEAVHAHEMSDVTGLTDALAELEEAISTVLNGGGSAGVAPMLVASMHLGKLDNNSGAENNSSTRICSEPFAVEPGKTYYQVNDKGVNMYVLIYDADELFLGYLGSFASGAEIPVTNENAAYMRLGSLLGEYDLTNEFRIYDVDPESGGSSAETVDAYSKEEADERFAAADHNHSGYAASSHTHTAADITGLPSSVDAYSKTEADGRFAPASHNHSGYAEADHSHTGYAVSGHTHTASDVGAAASNHSHTPASIGAAAASHSHSEYAPASHSHSGYASSGHTHHPANIGALSSSGGTISGALTVMLDSIFNGVLNTQKIQPKDSGSYSIGTADNRYYSAYLRANPNVSSDIRLKRDIAALNAGHLAEFVNKLSVVSYNYTDDAADEEKRIGVIAQDVISADPVLAQFFVEQSEKGFYSLRPADFVFPLIAAVQQLSARVAELEGK